MFNFPQYHNIAKKDFSVIFQYTWNQTKVAYRSKC